MLSKKIKVILFINFILIILLGIWEAWTQCFVFSPITFVFMAITPVFAISLILIIVISLILIFLKKYKAKFRKLRKIAILILIVCLLNIIIIILIVKSVNYTNTFLGQKIIVAINMHNANNGRYPDNLSEIVPDYLPEIPKNLWGDEFRYFKLNFHEVWNEEKSRWDKLNVTKYRLENSIGCGFYTQIYDSYDNVWFLWGD